MMNVKPTDDFGEQDKTRVLWEQIQKWKDIRKNGKLTVTFKHGKIVTVESTQYVD